MRNSLSEVSLRKNHTWKKQDLWFPTKMKLSNGFVSREVIEGGLDPI